MGSAVEQLIALVASPECHDVPYAELVPRQIEAANERLASRLDRIPLLAHRVETGGITAIRKTADLVPLLFAHTAYKSYPETWFTQGKWDRMCRWLSTISTYPVNGLDVTNVADVDDWLTRLATAGHFVSCSSGTTGKCSMLTASTADREMVKRSIVAAFSWATGLTPNHDYKTFGGSPMTQNPRNNDARDAICESFGDGSVHRFPGAPITIGQVTRMVALRRDIANGTASPGDIRAFDETSAARQATLEAGLNATAQAMAQNRHHKLVFFGLFATMFQIAEKVRALGFGGEDFHPENVFQNAGGLKGAILPPDYRERILSTFNIRDDRIFQFYSMQELNSTFPRCRAGRYHISPWVMLLVLDESGERLIDPAAGEVEGRAGFFDLSLDGRWGGIITGDKITADYGKCACGHQGPTVGSEIVRYADMVGGDKISCAGTIDAYIRGTGSA
jgi:hypothetical protein